MGARRVAQVGTKKLVTKSSFEIAWPLSCGSGPLSFNSVWQWPKLRRTQKQIMFLAHRNFRKAYGRLRYIGGTGYVGCLQRATETKMSEL